MSFLEYTDIYINMTVKKEKHLRVRVTESQMNRLIRKIKLDNITISLVIRDLIDRYLNGSCRIEDNHK